MKIRQASPNNEWVNYTDEHQDLRSYLSETIDAIGGGEERDPLAIVGPYRTGKTQLLYEAFTLSWESGVPALYTDANQLLRDFEEQSEETDIAKWLTNEVKKQVGQIRDGESPRWLPNWDNESREQDFLEQAQKGELKDISNTVLLVDEIEQAYTKLREGDFVDDDNPLRVLLDDTQGVFQIWAFGLVSAYELGEADYARFDERRIPILDFEDVASDLERRGKPVELASGIWWLARGRIGWTNKLVDECPDDLEGTADWVSWVSNEEFEGVTPLDQTVWTQEVTERDWDDARRAIVFLRDQYPDWQITHNKGHGIPVDDFASLALETLLEASDLDLSPTSKTLLERNIRRLCDSLCPVDSRTEGANFLPANLLNDLGHIQGFVDLLADIIISFEGGSDHRADATKCLQFVDTTSFRQSWNSQFYEMIDKEPDVEPWSIRPSILSDAYPAVAVDPTNLTDRSKDDWIKTLNRGIQVDTDLSFDHVEYEVRYCPTEELVRKELEAAGKPRDLNKVHVLVSEIELEDLELPSYYERLIELDRVHSHTHSATRFWDFVIQLYAYLFEERDFAEPISPQRKNDALGNEDDKEIRNTIDTLYEQLNNITETQTRAAVESFRERYSRRGANLPIWGENLSGDSERYPNTPPGVYGGGKSVRHALAYTLALSNSEIDEFQDVAGVVNVLSDGVDEYIEQPQKFGYTQFLESTLNENGVAEPLQKFSRRYHPADGARDTSIGEFQDLMLELSEAADTEEEQLWDLLIDVEADLDEIPVIANTEFSSQLASRFAWGILLEGVAVRRTESTRSLVSDCDSSLQDVSGRIETVTDEVRKMNRKLSPYEGHGSGVEIKKEFLTERKDHLADLSEYVLRLSKRCSDEDFLSIAVVYALIISKYLEVLEEQIEETELSILGSSLLEIGNLQGSFDRVEELIDGTDLIYENIDLEKEEVKGQLYEEAEEMFNFRKIAGTGRFLPTEKEVLERIDTSCGDSADELGEIEDRIRDLEKSIEERENRQEQLQKQFTDLAETVTR